MVFLCSAKKKMKRNRWLRRENFELNILLLLEHIFDIGEVELKWQNVVLIAFPSALYRVDGADWWWRWNCFEFLFKSDFVIQLKSSKLFSPLPSASSAIFAEEASESKAPFVGSHEWKIRGRWLKKLSRSSAVGEMQLQSCFWDPLRSSCKFI